MQKKQKQWKLMPKEFDDNRMIKISTFLILVLLTVTFPNVSIWLTYILSSLCQWPQLQSSLYTILCVANVVIHTK